jgi:hypothetical protein
LYRYSKATKRSGVALENPQYIADCERQMGSLVLDPKDKDAAPGVTHEKKKSSSKKSEKNPSSRPPSSAKKKASVNFVEE